MKELSIEQKAQAYDKALEIISDYYQKIEYSSLSNASTDREVLEKAFPQLKEGEDERIRNFISNELACLRAADEKGTIRYNELTEAIAWLEKQDEHANFRNKIEIGDKVTRNEDGVLVNLSQLKRVAKKDEKQGQQKSIKEHDICDTCDEKTSCVIPCPVKLVEQKPADKVEPIFNIGDTIAKKHNSDIHDFGSFTITDITGGKYWYNDRIICDITEQDEWELYEPVRQTPAEWSEEDKRNLNDAILFIKTGTYSLDKDNLINWLKSLRPQNTWKPSDDTERSN